MKYSFIHTALLLGLLMAICSACVSSAALVTKDGDRISVLQKFNFDCGRFRPPNQVSVSRDGRLLLVVGDCVDSQEYAAVSAFDLTLGALDRTWSAQRQSMHQSQNPILVGTSEEILVITIQSSSPGLNVDNDFFCVDRISATTKELTRAPCVAAGKVGLLIGADYDSDSQALLIHDIYQKEPRVWRANISSNDPERAELLKVHTLGAQLSSLEDFRITDAKFGQNNSVLLHMRRRAVFGTPEWNNWKMVHAEKVQTKEQTVRLLSEGENIECVAWLTPTGIIGNPWPSSNFDDECSLRILDDSGGREFIVGVLTNPKPDIRGIGVMAVSQSDCCLLVYSRQRSQIEIVDLTATDGSQLIDCKDLPFSRCGQVFALNEPGQFISVHGSAAYRFGVNVK